MSEENNTENNTTENLDEENAQNVVSDSINPFDEEENESDSVESADDSIKTDSDEKEPSRGKRIRNSIIEMIIYVLIIVICVAFVPKYVIQRTIVDGDSMMDTLQNNNNLLVEKVSYKFSDPDRFDVIVFYPHGRESEDYYIKRVIGLPGETIQIVGNTIYINGKVLKENYGKDPMTYSGIAAQPLKLGDDEFFVLGDNRTISEDSRYDTVGKVKRKNIAGHAILRIYPFSEFGTFQ